jgi:hypothetical protein
MFIGGITVASLFGLVFGWLVMIMWNWLLPHIFGLPTITYWQAFGLLLLSKLLLSGCRGPHDWKHHAHMHKQRHRHMWEKKYGNNIDEDWLPAGDYRNWMFYRDYWREKGKKDFEEYLNNRGQNNNSAHEE